MVSIIIPVYQVSEYVERCIRSVMAQSYQDIECVIVDDCGEDDSIEKCERLIKEYNEGRSKKEEGRSKKDDNLDENEGRKTKDDNVRGRIRFRIIRHERNRGLSAARNTGTHEATGDYLYYLDSDDYIAPDCIEKLVSVVLDDPSIEMVQGNCMMTSDDRETLLYTIDHPIKTVTNEEARKEFYVNRNIYISVWNRLLKKSFIEEYQLYCREGIVFEDLHWVFYLLKHLKRAYLCSDITYYYCLRAGSILVAAKPASVGSYAIIFDEIFHHLTEGQEQEEIKGFLFYFVKRYVSYVKSVPAFKDTIRLYKDRARKYRCWNAYLVLCLIGYVCRLGNPLGLIGSLNALRWKWKRFANEK